ncbi:hypothetical protein CsSME_00001271 [Camellia sinensis var. sinensis]
MTYYPQTHMLPPKSIQHFRGFARGAPEDLLLREPDSHLSCGTIEDSRSIRRYGAMSTRDWYIELPVGVCYIIDEAGFSSFCTGLSRHIVSRPLLGALVERWWDTTNSFHFSTAREMTMTPYDFSMLIGIGVGGHSIPYDMDIDGEPETPEETEHYANTVGLYLLSTLVDLPQVQLYDWGGASLATLYGYISSTSRRMGDRVGGYWRAWELEVEMPPVVPYSHRYDDRCLRRTWETFSFFRWYFELKIHNHLAALGDDVGQNQGPVRWSLGGLPFLAFI